MTSALITAAIILGAVFIFIILFIFLHLKGHNKKLAKQKVVFADIVWKNKLDISEKETINEYLLAIDRTNFVLLYINFSEPKEVVSLIDLWNIKTVKVTTEEDSVYMQRKWKPVLLDKNTKQIQLEVTLVDSQQKVELVLYEDKNGMQDLAEVKRRADYWCHLINISVQELPHPAKGMKLSSTRSCFFSRPDRTQYSAKNLLNYSYLFFYSIFYSINVKNTWQILHTFT